ncbi:MAG: squalene--hopene cyclase [Bacteroidales bacterium]|nr:squalene--hopene cyclase [Bacteroidales bacterium]
MKIEEINEMYDFLTYHLKKSRSENGMWRGHLSSSAISTSVSIYALYCIDKEKYADLIASGAQWLIKTMKPDGSWGDSIESPTNMTATLLSFVSLTALDKVPTETRAFLEKRFVDLTDERIINGVLDYYGKDLTFSVPILSMCALSGVISNWNMIPQFPFEASVLPQSLYRFLRLPVVSYAIPALIAIGILRFRKGRKNILSPIREMFVDKSLKILSRIQPANGGFLEAAPLTAFVSMCLCGAGYSNLEVTQKCADFLVSNVREDCAWPIDTDLANWVTSLAIRGLAGDVDEREKMIEKLCDNAFKYKHPFTGALPGGWGWTDLRGSVPDADDTSGSLVALYALTKGKYLPEVADGINWLLELQNADGGMPTFCKGWGKLPFDRSSADISAHAFYAFNLWKDSLPQNLRVRCEKSSKRLLNWLNKSMSRDGSWLPLWFGDQDAPNMESPVYGTSTTVEYLSLSDNEEARLMVEKGVKYIEQSQNEDGGWSGTKGMRSKVTLTSRALGALASSNNPNMMVIEKGFAFLYDKYKSDTIFEAEPIGLYFAKLWYSEDLYNITFTMNALNRLKAIVK